MAASRIATFAHSRLAAMAAERRTVHFQIQTVKNFHLNNPYLQSIMMRCLLLKRPSINFLAIVDKFLAAAPKFKIETNVAFIEI